MKVTGFTSEFKLSGTPAKACFGEITQPGGRGSNALNLDGGSTSTVKNASSANWLASVKYIPFNLKDFDSNINYFEFTNKGHFCESDLGTREFPEFLNEIESKI